MSDREMLIHELQTAPDYQIAYLLGVYRGMNANIPNEETEAAIRDLDAGLGETFEGDTSDFISAMLKD